MLQVEAAAAVAGGTEQEGTASADSPAANGAGQALVSSKPLKKGDRVEANWMGQGKYYPGRPNSLAACRGFILDEDKSIKQKQLSVVQIF
jgi:hypothetical protein